MGGRQGSDGNIPINEDDGGPNQYSLVVSVDWSGWCCVWVPCRLFRR